MYKVETNRIESEWKDWQHEITIQDDSGIRAYSDQCEPEDNSFRRDYSWIRVELERAYEQGLKDGKQK